MKKFFSTYFIFLTLLSMIFSLTAMCVYIERKKSQDSQTPTQTILSRIIKVGKIRMLTENSANSYYIYRDKPMGFEYDLAKEFAAFLQVDLEVLTPGPDNIFAYLDMDRGDFVASGVTITEKREKDMLFTQPYMDVEQKFIYNKNKLPIKSVKDLPGRTIHVTRNSTYHDRLIQLKKRGIDIDMVLHDDLSTEELLRMVSDNNNDINYTIADSNIAKLNRRYYPDICIGIPLQNKEYIGWAVRKRDVALSDKMVQFFDIIKSNGIFDKIYEKYYGHLDIGFDYYDLKSFHEGVETKLPKYKKTIIKESDKHGFDWRIIAAVIYQESHFDPKARSHTGVRGLMQVTEAAASEMGITNRRDPLQSLKAGIGYLSLLYRKFTYVHDSIDRIKFALASYNVGYGHVLDAQRLAKLQGKDATRWDSINETLPLLSKSRYYSKTKYGYARGHEPVRYIEKIFAYYDILKQKAHAEG